MNDGEDLTTRMQLLCGASNGGPTGPQSSRGTGAHDTDAAATVDDSPADGTTMAADLHKHKDVDLMIINCQGKPGVAMSVVSATMLMRRKG